MRKLAHEEIPRLRPSENESVERSPICVLLEDVRSAHNVGSVMRTADAILAREVILSGYSPDGNHKGVHKSALGAQDFVPWRQVENAVDEIHRLKQNGYTVAALEITDSPTVAADLPESAFPLCLVAGNEVAGVSDDTLNACDFAIELPQLGVKQSLNVSVAVGIMLFDLLRHYRNLTYGDG